MTLTGDSANVLFDKSDSALEFADNAKITFGDDSDLKIHHSADVNQITTNSKELQILGGGSNNKKIFVADTGSSGDNSADLYFDNTKKFETASGGVSLTGGAAANITALSDGSTITIDMATACHHSVTLGGNRTFAAPSNQVVGQAGSIFITQDGTGSRTASFYSAFKCFCGRSNRLHNFIQ